MQEVARDGSDISRHSSFSNQLYSLVFDGTEPKKREHRYETVVRQCNNWWARQVAAHRARVGTFSFVDWLGVFLPCVNWLRRYKFKESLYGDITAGLSIGIMVVPQGMSYALLAGLPPVFGLYGAFVPVLVYAVFGSSPQLAVGPVAITSLLLGNGLDNIIKGSDAISDPSDPGSPELETLQQKYNECAIQVAFIVSILYTLVGVFRLGFLANFLSHSVISGFTTGASIIIGLSQLKYFFGVKTPNTNTAIETIRELAKVIDKSQWREMVMFAVWLTVLLVIKKVAKSKKKLSWLRSIGPISVCLLGIVFVAALNLDNGKVKVVKSIPSGLPPVTISNWGPLFRGETNFGKQITLAIIVMLVDFMESISIAKALARRGKYKIRVTQEIIGLGLANFAGSAFSAYTTTGSFSRSAVSADIGSKTGLFGVICSLLVMFILLVLTPLFELVPYNVMGAIVVSACVGLFEASEAIFLYRANFLDFLVWMAAFLGTVLAGVEIGLAIAIGLALLLVVYQSAFPHTAVLGRLPGTNVYRSVQQYPSAIMQKGMLIMRIDAPVYFANVQWFRSRLSDYLRSARENPELAPIHFVILDLSPVPFIDATGMHAFVELIEELKDERIQLVLANPCYTVKEHLARIHVLEAIGKEWIFVRTSNAVEVCSKAVMENNLAKNVEDSQPDRTDSSEDIAAERTPDANAVDGPALPMPIHWTE